MSSSVSVVIATYNRAALLSECLDHLARQPFNAGDEIIVVDNGSTDGTPGVIRSHQAGPVKIVGLTETRAGKSHAVAAALAVARGDILAFTDDDVNVDVGWLYAIRSALDGDTAVALVGGPVEPRWEAAAPFWLHFGRGYGRLAAPLALLDYGDAPTDLGSRTVLGANMAVRRDVLDQLGGFATHLGKLRGTLLSGEDHELCRRVQQAGYGARYCPAALVRHWVPASRMRVGYFLRWFFWSGITNAELDRHHPPQAPTLFGVPLHFFKVFATSVAAGIAAAGLLRWHTAVDRATEAAFAAGYAARRSGAL
jgi:GT2 family glycosyltransferase